MANPLYPVLVVLHLSWTLILFTFYNTLAFLKNLIPAALWPHKDVSKDIVLITGGGSGIGRLMCLEFGKLGSTVVVWDINGATAQEVVNEIRALGGKAYSYVVDVRDNEAVYKVADKVREDVGQVTILINNAGVLAGKKFLQCPDRSLQRTMDVNIHAHFWTLKAFLPYMVEKDRGHIVTVASVCGLAGFNGVVDYCTSKFAAIGLDDALYHELYYSGKRGINLTVVCPYGIDTGMFAGAKIHRYNPIQFLKPDYVAKEIVTSVLTNQRFCILPKLLIPLPAIKSLFSTEAFRAVHEFTGFDHAMDTYVGHGKEE